ncbi:MAG TPA: outer membrane beta-barrel protein [Candidatus Cybelea sp.]|nr:outer membrane beta-barrel protein [Candidatus Cybelea sp.]
MGIAVLSVPGPAWPRASGLYDFAQVYADEDQAQMQAAQATKPPLAPPSFYDIPKGWYGTVWAGGTQAADISGASSGATAKVSFSLGFAGAFAGGYAFGNGFRAEGEVGYLRAPLDKLSTTFGNAELSGVRSGYGAFVNGYYDLETGSLFTPYAGGGVGVVHFNNNTVTATINGTKVSATTGTENKLGLQGEAGLAMRITDSIWVTPAYRFLWVDDASNGSDHTRIHIFKFGALMHF